MPMFRFAVQRISRGAGRSAPAAAAYRAGERIRDERTGVLHNYSRRNDVMHREILLPQSLPRGAAEWALDRARLWNVAEAAEPRRNSLVAREYQLALPHELAADRRLQLARTFAQQLADRHRIVVDLALHAPRAEGDPRNFHAHLLVTTRELTAHGLGAKAGLDQPHARSEGQGLLGRGELGYLRERWAASVNEAYMAAGLDLRVDARTLSAQGLDRAPSRPAFIAIQIERRRLRREMLDRLADRYEQRVLGGREGTERSARARVGVSAIEEARQQGIEAWRALRRSGATPERSAQNARHEAQEEALEGTSAARDEDQAL